MAARDLGLSVSTASSAALGATKEFPWHKNVSKVNPLVFSEYQKLARHYNLLLDEYERIERSRQSMLLEEVNPKGPSDAVARLQSAASSRLLEELDSVELTLYRARAEQREISHGANG